MHAQVQLANELYTMAIFFKRLAAMQAEKHHSTYSTVHVMARLRCHLTFTLPGRFDLGAADLAMSEGQVEQAGLMSYIYINLYLLILLFYSLHSFIIYYYVLILMYCVYGKFCAAKP